MSRSETVGSEGNKEIEMTLDMEEEREMRLMDFRFQKVIIFVSLAVGEGVMISRVMARLSDIVSLVKKRLCM